jgi:hypothetical protein
VPISHPSRGASPSVAETRAPKTRHQAREQAKRSKVAAINVETATPIVAINNEIFTDSFHVALDVTGK